METLKRLIAVSLLMLVLGVTCFAGAPCSQDPGQTSTPPCSAAPSTTNSSTNTGETNTPPAVDSVDVLSVAEIALEGLLTLL